MSFRLCTNGCGAYMASFDGDHAKAGLAEASCVHCERMTIGTLSGRPVITASPSSTHSQNASAALVREQGDLRVTVCDVPPGKAPRKSRSSKRGPVELPKHDTRPSRYGPSVSFGAPEEDMMSIVASEEDVLPAEADGSAGQSSAARAAQSEFDAELAAMLLRAAKSIELEVPKAPSPERSRLDDWFLVPFFPEVHEELTKTWAAPITARPRQSSSLLTTLDGGAARGHVDVPQVERVIVVHLCPQNAATRRNRPRLPSKACKLSSTLAAKAYGAVGQADSALHAMAILQVYQAKALKQLHEGSSDSEVMQELRSATDFALRATKVTARALGQVMSTMVVQERHLWLNLAQMSDVDKVRFLDASVSQVGLFGDTVEDFAQQFSAVQKQTEAIKHILPRRDKALGARPPPAWGAWLALPSPSRWLIRTVRLGYAIQFARRPPKFRGIHFTSVQSDTDASVLRAEIVGRNRACPSSRDEGRVLHPLLHRTQKERDLGHLGLRVNWEKSKLSPVQSVSFLGMELDSVNMTARLTNERVQSMLNCLELFRCKTAVHLKYFQRLLGHMAAAAAIRPLGLLHMRPLQCWLHDRVPRWAWHRGTFWVGVTPECGLLFSLRHKHVLVRTDNTATVAYINHQGGLLSRRMSQLARHLLLWSQTRLKSLCAVNIPGELNRAADALSRQLTHPGEWRLNPQGRTGTQLAPGASQVRLSPSETPCTDPVQDQGGRGAGSAGCALLAHPNLVCRPHASCDSPSLEDSPEEGPSFSGDGHDLAPASRPVEPPRVAPGRDAAHLAGLPQAVVDTITLEPPLQGRPTP
ncbi:hypothetical protein M9458_057656 [Cirrhinus mrigala]|uniref:RNase H type-1 domain-containing protein n=1 Tax=Cirrhinus mrigala TaxID=683832 RepID=A0ABD0MEF2_CIRMR